MRSSKPHALSGAFAFPGLVGLLGLVGLGSLAGLVSLVGLAGLSACQSTDADDEGIYQGIVGETTEWEAVLDKEWRLESIDQKPVVPGTTVTLWLRGDSLNGDAGANRYSAEFQRVDQSLTIGAIAATRMFHDDPPGTMVQEADYLRVLGEVDSYRLVDGTLQLRQGDRVRLAFRRS